jgi:hypothetical protein
VLPLSEAVLRAALQACLHSGERVLAATLYREAAERWRLMLGAEPGPASAAIMSAVNGTG